MPENIRTTEEGEAQNNSSSSTPTAKDLAKNLSENTEPQYTIFEQIPVHSHGIRVICIAFKETLPGNTTPRYVLKIANNRE